MEPTFKRLTSTRTDLIQVHENCLTAPYVEIEIPSDATMVHKVWFEVVSRDQGWADDKSTSFTFFYAAVRRPENRSSLRLIRLGRNRCANSEFFKWVGKCDDSVGDFCLNWLRALQPGDVVQFVPTATYRGWVNIIQSCTITIHYDSGGEVDHALPVPLAPDHYRSRLESSTSQIRIIVVEPGAYEDPMLCHFDTIRLTDRNAAFDALSYCWSSATDWTEIGLAKAEGEDHRSFRVTHNVESALRRFRKQDTVVRLWTDAVCINQGDFEERARQVNMMGEIYSRAEVVHVWLGDEDYGIENCLRLIRDIYNCTEGKCDGGDACSCPGSRHSLQKSKIKKWTNENRRPPTRSFWALADIYGEFELKPQDRPHHDLIERGRGGEGLLNLMGVLYEHPWFSRVWVVQEVLLARQVCLRCGPEMAPWGEMMSVTTWLEGQSLMAFAEYTPTLPPIWKRLGSRLHKNALFHLNEDASSRQQNQVSLPDLSILEVFTMAMELKATDPRDKLFALFALGSETQTASMIDPSISANYEKPLELVFADFTRWWIREYKSLSILSTIHSHPTRAWRNTLTPTHQSLVMKTGFQKPTWAIGSEGRSLLAEATIDAKFSFNATGDSVPDPDLINLCPSNPLLLQLKGWEISKIRDTGHYPIERMYPYYKESERGIIETVFDGIFDLCSRHGFWSRDRRTSEEQKSTRYMDHVCAHWRYFRRAKLTALAPSRKSDNSVFFEKYQTCRLPTCLHECFFVSDDGRFGLCPWRAEKGDVIVLLAGGNVPYLLREVKHSEPGDHEPFFEFVGECYVDGIMNGEFFEENGQNLNEQLFSLV